jgi:hypothetical protein
MATATSSSRPLSLFHSPVSLDPSSLDQLTPLRRPRSPVTSHYRPFSIHIAETSSEPRRRSIIRSPSLSSMGFHFTDKAREKEKAKEREKGKGKERVYPESHLTAIANRPSTSSALFTLPRERGLKKKRSLSSLRSAASESDPDTNTLSSGALTPAFHLHTRSPLATSVLSPVDESNAIDDTTIKGSEAGKLRHRRMPSNNFVPKNNWLKRQNMKVHPYLLEAPYMQAYEPLQLEKWVSRSNMSPGCLCSYLIAIAIQIFYCVD